MVRGSNEVQGTAPDGQPTLYDALSRTAILRGRFRGRRRQVSIVSKQDTHFFNVFSLVIGLLVAVAIGLFALARIVAW